MTILSEVMEDEAANSSPRNSALHNLMRVGGGFAGSYEQSDNHNVSDKEDSTVSSCCESCGCTLGNGQTSICGLCDKKNTIENERSNSKLSLEQQAKKMKFRSINKFPPCNVGDTVRVKLPEVISKGDPQNVLVCGCVY
ncbi:hypothetical protein ACI65C_006845 [Semiaphis heraclei]